VKRCFFSVEPRVVFTTRQLLPATNKGVLPSHHQSNVIDQFVCHCDSRYVGRTSQRLEERIKQHIPKSIANPSTPHIRQSLPRPVKATSPHNFTNPPSLKIFLTTPNAPYITIKTSSRSSSHSISFLCPRSDLHQISESPSLQTKRIRLLLEDLLNLMNSFHWLIVSTSDNSCFLIS